MHQIIFNYHFFQGFFNIFSSMTVTEHPYQLQKRLSFITAVTNPIKSEFWIAVHQ
jgi:hypothetical protein